MVAQVSQRNVTSELLRSGATVGVFRALYLGDLLCSVPAVRALKRANPDMRLILIGLPWAESFAERFAHYFDGFIPVPSASGLHDHPAGEDGLEQALEACRKRGFDVVVQMHGSGPQSNTVVRRMAARFTAGFHPANGLPPEDGDYFPYPPSGSEVQRLLALTRRLGIEPAGTRLEFPLTPADESAYCALAARAGLVPGRYACIHPGAKLASRRWPPERFARVADSLAATGLKVVITGTRDERPIAAAVASAMTAPAVNLAGKTDLGALGALVSKASLLVSNDTGVSHVAAALQTPSVVIACGSDTARWAPEDAALHRTLAHDIDCRPCACDACPIGHPCATAITPEAVAAEARSLLATRAGAS